MADDDQAGILDTLLTPLTLPRRAAKDLEAIGTAARTLPGFERVLLDRLDDFGADVRDLGSELKGAIDRVIGEMEGLDRRVAALQLEVAQLNRDLAATKGHAAQLNDQVSDAVEYLPDPNSRGPIARARDAIAGTSDPSEQA